MDYYALIQSSLTYIECHLDLTLSLEKMANTFHVSKFYYQRIFTAVMGCSLKEYVLSRKLNKAVEWIIGGNKNLTEITYDLSFSSQSSFNRAFKRHYHITPSTAKKKQAKIQVKPIPTILKRPLKNLNGDVVTEFTILEHEALDLIGIPFEVDLATENYKEKIRSHAHRIQMDLTPIKDKPCYMVYSNCMPNSSTFRVFFGIKSKLEDTCDKYIRIRIPKLLCTGFRYYGDLMAIGEIFSSDLARFLRISKLEVEQNTIDLIQAFDTSYKVDAPFKLYVPIKRLHSEKV